MLAWQVINIDDAFGAQLAATAPPARLIVTTRTAAVGARPPAARYVRAARAAPDTTGLVIAHRIELGRGRARRAR